MSSFKLTQSQQQAIDSDGSTLVSAAAGSGKTAVLTKKVLHYITDPVSPVDVDRLLVVTFTKAAAAEMLSRVSENLNASAAADPQNTRLRRQVMLLSKASICSMDSFCHSLAAEYFSQLEISPDFKLLSEDQASVMRENAMEETLEHFFEADPEAFSSLCNILGDRDSDRLAAEAISRIFDFTRSLPYPDEWLDDVVSKYDNFTNAAQSVWGRELIIKNRGLVSAALSAVEAVAAKIQFDEVLFETRSEALDNDINALSSILEALTENDWDNIRSVAFSYEKMNFLKAHGSYDLSLKDKADKVHKNTASVIGALQNDFQSSNNRCVVEAKQTQQFVSTLVNCVRYYSAEYARLKSEADMMDFADIEFSALRLLVRREKGISYPTDISKEICGRFDHVMVDEYQDTNDLQNEIFRIISGDGTRLFAVGDVKQSIYRFRKANPEIFLRLLSSCIPYDGKSFPCKIILGENFRSRSGICDFVNHTFRLLMSKQAGEMDYTAEHELHAAGSFPERNEPDVAVHFIDADSQSNNPASPVTPAVAEALHICGIIKDMMSRECISDGDKLRKARFSDFALLARTGKKMPEYLETFLANGIPASADADENILENTDIVQLISLLRVIDNPSDDVALLSCLLSPLFGFTADEVARIRAGEKKLSFYANVIKAAQNGNARFSEFLKTLDKLRNEALCCPVGTLIEKIIMQTGFSALVSVSGDASRRRANLLKFISAATDFEISGKHGLSGFLRFISRLNDSGKSIPGASPAVGENAVRIMTIHHSKGLQFPVCFYVGSSSKFNRTDEHNALLSDISGGIGVKINEGVAVYDTFIRRALSEMSKRAYISEELRIMYVAMTRPIDNLYIIYSSQNLSGRLTSLASSQEYGFFGRDQSIDPVTILNAIRPGDLLFFASMFHPDGEQLRLFGDCTITPCECGCPADIRAFFSDDTDSDTTPAFLESGENVSADLEPSADTVVFKDNENEADASLLKDIERKIEYQYPFGFLNSVTSKQSVSRLSEKHEIQKPLTARPLFLSESGFSPAEKGTTIHAFLRYADLSAASTNCSAELSRLVKDKFLTQNDADAVNISQLETFFGSNLFKRMQNSSFLRREQSFLYEVPASEIYPKIVSPDLNEVIVIQGTADCVFTENGNLILVDYKTDRVSDLSVLALRYGPQMDYYAKALASVFNLVVSSRILYSLYLGKELVL